jgi:hypothetical protein
MINDLKDLKSLLKLCRTQGVTEIELGTVKIKLGDLPVDNNGKTIIDNETSLTDNPYANFPDGILTPEQLMFYSSGGLPEEDPALKDKQ